MKRSDFVKRTAEAYQDAEISLAPWEAYANEVVQQWKDINYPVKLVTSACPYLRHTQLQLDIEEGNELMVWKGGKFHANHPLLGEIYTGYRSLQRYQISRALHDYVIHYQRDYSFSPFDELMAAFNARHDFSPLAQQAQFTDDVAMGCYYAHFGKWPQIQYPVIVKPDWEGLQEYLYG